MLTARATSRTYRFEMPSSGYEHHGNVISRGWGIEKATCWGLWGIRWSLTALQGCPWHLLGLQRENPGCRPSNAENPRLNGLWWRYHG